ncbi:MAG TPA: PqqD family protein [Acidimicrobiales bacterium]|nr:PqqD family protein [Acidimicrobiales bacterium]
MTEEVRGTEAVRAAGRQVRRRTNDLICREVEGKMVGLDLRSSRYFSLNPTGALLWHMLEDGSDPDAMADALCRANAIDVATAHKDVDSFIGMLAEQGLLE